jgi:hypothetical protein
MEPPVAKQVSVSFIDDLDGSDAAESVTFSLDGRGYEIDLSGDNAAKLRDALAPFVAGARRAGRTAGPARVQRMVDNRGQSSAIRQWARDNGHDLADRGRIPANVIDAYANRDAVAAAAPAAEPEADAAPEKHASKKSAPPVTDPFQSAQAAS